MRIDIVTLFPAMLEVPLAQSILGRARARGLVDVRVHDLREHAAGRHRVTDAIVRLLPGVLGDEDAPARDSFARGLLEHPQYTRPEVFRGAAVPEVLRSGDHGRIARWRQLMSLWRTWQRRPDLLETADLTPEEQKWTDGFRQGRTPSDFLD